MPHAFSGHPASIERVRVDHAASPGHDENVTIDEESDLDVMSQIQSEISKENPIVAYAAQSQFN